MLLRKDKICWVPGLLLMGCWPIILSAPILILLPPLGTLEMFFARRGIAFLRNPQILEQDLLGISWSKSCCLGVLRYWVFNTFFHQAGFPLMSLHTILPPKARFRSFCDLIPSPPCSWDWITYFQFIRLYFFLSFPPLPKKVTKDGLHFVVKTRWGLQERELI